MVNGMKVSPARMEMLAEVFVAQRRNCDSRSERPAGDA
jgi:hypothetical protein